MYIPAISMPRQKRVRIDQFTPHPEDANAASQIADLASFRLNDDGRIYCVEFGRHTTEEHISQLTRLQCVTEVSMVHHGKTEPLIADAAIRRIVALPNLAYLNCINQPLLSNSTLKIVATSKSITRVGFPGVEIDDAGVHHLGSMHQLIALSLNGTGVSDCSVDCLLGLTKLRVLDILQTDITLHGMRTLANGLTELKRFQYSKREITND